ncbi:glycogenin-1 isoform X2 [Culicoides brevitarsis]|uniref:glycogenin-1 isoform X2 n=1 Tax=Culicoides brevitarsis TaxID=469753 RepID=UPI00307B7C4D
MPNYAWVTLATNDSYALGALVLAKSLKSLNTAYPCVVLVTDGVTPTMRTTLSEVFQTVQMVDLFDSKDEAHLSLIRRPELGITFTKIACWKLTQFEKCVFLDADTLVLRNSDSLFDRDELSAAPDVGWPDCFNSGVFVFKPSMETYNKITEFALTEGSFDGGDQGLLNSYFSNWKDVPANHLPFVFNCSISTVYSYLPAFKRFEKDINIIHFLGSLKPWQVNFDFERCEVGSLPAQYYHLRKYFGLWWKIFSETVHQSLTEDMAGLAGSFARARLGEARKPCIESWHEGNIDYLGIDSFSNILSKLEETLEKPGSSSSK